MNLEGFSFPTSLKGTLFFDKKFFLFLCMHLVKISSMKLLDSSLSSFLFSCFISFLLIFSPVQARANIFGNFSIADEKKLGQEYHTLILATYPIVNDPEVEGYIKDIVHKVAAAMPPQPFPITTTVVNNGSINAFATPGGYIYIFTGLITEFDNDAQLAGVIAHELAHVSQRHVAGRIERGSVTQLGVLAGMLAGMLLSGSGNKNASEVGTAIAVGSAAAGNAAMLDYSRADEREADHVGMNYLVKSGFAPSGMPEAFKRIQSKQYLTGSSIPAYLSTHPAVGERIDYLEERILAYNKNTSPLPADNSKFKRIQTLVRARYIDEDHALTLLQKEEKNAVNLMGQGIVYARKNRIKLAANAFSTAINLAGEDPLILREAGIFHYRQSRADLAKKYLDAAIGLNPNDIFARFYLARLQADQGKTGPALKNFKKVLAVLPHDPDVHHYLALLQARTGNLFQGHLHMAYWAVYSLNAKKAALHMQKAKAKAKSPAQKEQLQQLEDVYQKRSSFWKKGKNK